MRGDVRPQWNLPLSLFLDSYPSSDFFLICGLGISKSMIIIRPMSVNKSKLVDFKPYSQILMLGVTGFYRETAVFWGSGS